MLIAGICLLTPVYAEVATPSNDEATFVGSQTCSECHPDEYESFIMLAKKAHSYEHILPLKDKLTPSEFKECCACHTTGYGQPGGFVSVDQTPQMRNLGCESCHGPGSRHSESEDPDEIIAEIDIKSCARCHNSERVAAFDYKPLLHGGAH